MVTPKGIDDALSHGFDALLARSVPFIPQITRSGIYLGSMEKKPRLMSHFFANKLRLDGQEYVVGFVLREDGNGKRFYDHELTRIVDPSSLNSASPSKEEARTETRANRDLEMTILLDTLGVNVGTGTVLFQPKGKLPAETRARVSFGMREDGRQGLGGRHKKPAA